MLVNYAPYYDQLSKTSSLGGDDVAGQGVYSVLAAMEAHLRENSPPFACQAGCIQCCTSQMPMVSSLEWKFLLVEILRLSKDTQVAIIKNAEMLRPYAKALRIARERAHLDEYDDAVPVTQCPILVKGQCSAYAGRPLVCRLYGYTTLTVGDKPTYAGCELAIAHLKQVTNGRELQYPAAEPLMRRVETLNQQSDEWTWAYLPQWIWTHIKNGQFINEAMWSPNFDLM